MANEEIGAFGDPFPIIPHTSVKVAIFSAKAFLDENSQWSLILELVQCAELLKIRFFSASVLSIIEVIIVIVNAIVAYTIIRSSARHPFINREKGLSDLLTVDRVSVPWQRRPMTIDR